MVPETCTQPALPPRARLQPPWRSARCRTSQKECPPVGPGALRVRGTKRRCFPASLVVHGEGSSSTCRVGPRRQRRGLGAAGVTLGCSLVALARGGSVCTSVPQGLLCARPPCGQPPRGGCWPPACVLSLLWKAPEAQLPPLPSEEHLQAHVRTHIRVRAHHGPAHIGSLHSNALAWGRVSHRAGQIPWLLSREPVRSKFRLCIRSREPHSGFGVSQTKLRNENTHACQEQGGGSPC